MKSSPLNTVIVLLVLGSDFSDEPSSRSILVSASKQYNRYLAHIFNRYGNGGTIPFEGLEHLMHNLGLGGLEFNPKHTLEEHHPDGYKIPDLFLDDNNFPHKEEGSQKARKTEEQIEVKELQLSSTAASYTTKTGNEEIMQNDEEIENDFSINKSDDILLMDENLNFKEMHDPKHRHPRHYAEPDSSNKCLSPASLLKLVMDTESTQNYEKLNYETNLQKHIGNNNNKDRHRSRRHAFSSSDNNDNDDKNDETDLNFFSHVKITPAAFLKMCPALLVQIDQDACAQRLHTSETTKLNTAGYSYVSAWIYASIAIFIISCCGLFGVIIIPLAKSVAYNEILKFLVAVAIGTLCGDALMHLIPHALIKETSSEDLAAESSKHSHGHSNEPVLLCSCAFLTALFMYSLEVILPLIRGDNSDHHHGHSHHHHHHHNQSQQNKNDDKPSVSESARSGATQIDMEIIPNQKQISIDAKEINTMLNEKEIDKKSVKLSPVAFMVILGDGLHNITDGLAIGAAFAGDPITGMATAFAVLCHELPHELGDFALLLQTGVHIKRAIFLNVVSSILSFVGMGIGLIVAGIHTNMVRWIYASTAGSFLYIALADLIPEMNKDGKRNFKNSLIQILGIFFGGAIMLLIALNEDNLRILFE